MPENPFGARSSDLLLIFWVFNNNKLVGSVRILKMSIKDYQDRGRGECLVFDKVVRKQHQLTSDCQQAIEAEELRLFRFGYAKLTIKVER